MTITNTALPEIVLRAPVSTDGADVYALIKRCPPLDTNSMYCNLLQCSHFASTSVAAIANNELVGFISGYLIPERPDTLFIWQVAVADTARGQGLAGRMVRHILARPHCQQVSQIETSITEANKASWALFTSLAKQLKAPLNTSVLFDKAEHFNGAHDTESLVCIGPIG